MLHWSALAPKRSMVAIVCGGDAGNIGNVFRQRLLAIYGQIGEGFIGVVLSGEFCRRGSEVCEVRWGPPIAHASFCVERAALSIERVADLMADDGADGAIVRSRRRGGIEERRLQNRGREVKRILQRQVHRVHRLRRHGPLLPIYELADSRYFRVVVEQSAAPAVAEEIIWLYLVAGIIEPGFRIPDSHVKRIELGN